MPTKKIGEIDQYSAIIDAPPQILISFGVQSM